MIDVSEIDLDSLTELELWELHFRIEARLGGPEMSSDGYFDVCPAALSSFESHAARARMRAHV